MKSLPGAALERAEQALAQLPTPAAFDVEAAEARLREMLMGAVGMTEPSETFDEFESTAIIAANRR